MLKPPHVDDDRHLGLRYEDLKTGAKKNCALHHLAKALIESAKQNTPPVRAGCLM